MDIKKQIKKATKDDRTVIGSKETLKNIEEMEKVIVASGVPEEVLKNVEEGLDSETELVRFEGSNKKLGSMCGKPFNVATVGIKKKQRIV